MSTDCSDGALLFRQRWAVETVGGMLEIIARKVGGILDSHGKIPAHQKVRGGPSVIHDVVAVIKSKEGGQLFSTEANAEAFLIDAFAHCKFIANVAEAMPPSVKEPLSTAHKRPRVKGFLVTPYGLYIVVNDRF